jgi:hypothetical protein
MSISNWIQFNESFTKVIKSVYDFINTIGDIDNKDFFIDELNSFCHYNDIPLSKLTGKYLNRPKAIKEIRFKYEGGSEIGIFLFKLDKFIGYEKLHQVKSSIDYMEEIINSDFDFAVVIDINEQQKGLKEIRRKRSLNQDGVVPLKSDDFHRNRNIQRYKEILRKKKSPELIIGILEFIIKNHSIDDIPKVVSKLKRSIPDDLYNDIVNKLYDYNILSVNDYYFLSSNKYGYI